MSVELLTKHDLQQFKAELLQELQNLLTEAKTEKRKWLKSYEVREMLGISPGTLQTLRINGTLAYTKIGGLMFYNYEDLVKLMDGKRKPARR